MSGSETKVANDLNGSTQPTAVDSQASDHVISGDSQTASDSQLKLEADAREALPFTFDYCTKPLGALKQNAFSCLTCNPPPASPADPYAPAGLCYACSIACHGEHTLVELFARRDFVCDCGTTKLPGATPCTLRLNAQTGKKGAVRGEEPWAGNAYNQNYRNRFCGCGELYDAHQQKGTMFQCLGLATEAQGGCGEDWWHPECLMGLPRDWHVKQQPKSISTEEDKVPNDEKSDTKAEEDVEAGGNTDKTNGASADPAQDDVDEHPVPPGFPDEDDFDTLICYKCVAANPWIKRYALSEGFRSLPYKASPAQVADAEVKQEESEASAQTLAVPTNGESRKRRAADDAGEESPADIKRAKTEETPSSDGPEPLHAKLPDAPKGPISIVSTDSAFRAKFCRCADCFPLLNKHPQLLEEEETYEPPVSEDGDGNGNGSVGTGSLLDRGEAALSNVDRVRAIEGVMAYNHLKEKVKNFLQPFAQTGQAVSAEDVKSYFEKLRGDDAAIKAAGGAAVAGGDGPDADNRREQSGY